MGNFYTNFTAKTDSQTIIIDALRANKRVALVSPVINDYLVVFDRSCEDQNYQDLLDVGRLLSETTQGPVLGVLNHDDDMLCYLLFINGELQDEYNSEPQYFDDDASPDRGGDPELLCSAFDCQSAVDRVREILEGDDHTFACELHQILVDTLGLPTYAVDCGYYSKEVVELPPDLSADDLVDVE